MGGGDGRSNGGGDRAGPSIGTHRAAAAPHAHPEPEVVDPLLRLELLEVRDGRVRHRDHALRHLPAARRLVCGACAGCCGVVWSRVRRRRRARQSIRRAERGANASRHATIPNKPTNGPATSAQSRCVRRPAGRLQLLLPDALAPVSGSGWRVVGETTSRRPRDSIERVPRPPHIKDSQPTRANNATHPRQGDPAAAAAGAGPREGRTPGPSPQGRGGAGAPPLLLAASWWSCSSASARVVLLAASVPFSVGVLARSCRRAAMSKTRHLWGKLGGLNRCRVRNEAGVRGW